MKKNCPYFKECGGCNKLDLSYEAEIEEKEALVAKLFKRVNYTKKIEVVNNCVNDTIAVKEMIEQKKVEVARRQR